MEATPTPRDVGGGFAYVMMLLSMPLFGIGWFVTAGLFFSRQEDGLGLLSLFCPPAVVGTVWFTDHPLTQALVTFGVICFILAVISGAASAAGRK